MKHAFLCRFFPRWLLTTLAVSVLASLAFATQVATPTISVNPFRSGYCYVIVTTVPGATSHYTLDGSVPSELSPTVPASGIVRVAKADISFKARAWQDGLDPSNVATVAPFGTPIQVHGSYSAGENHTLAVLPGGLVESWGSNGQYRLGNLVAPVLGQTTEVLEGTGTPFTNVIQVAASWQSAAGNAFSAALVDPDGSGNNIQIYAWGANNAGQLGNHSVPPSLFPSSAAPVGVCSTSTPTLGGWLHDVYMVATGEEYGVALTTSGEVHAWGQNALGQLGTGVAGSYRNYTAAVQYNDNVTSGPLTGQWTVAAGSRHALSIGADNQIWAWGDNASKQLGQSTTVTATNIPVAKPVVGLPAGVSWFQVAAGDSTSAAVASNGEIWVWGNSANGRLGDGLTTATPTPRRVKANATTIFTGASSISMGLDHMLIVKNDGTVWATGYNANGQLGNGTVTASTYPVQVKLTSTTYLTDVVSVDAGGGYSTAMTNDGVIYTWGSNSVGQTGGTTTANKTYASTATNIPNLNTPTLFQGATFTSETGVREDNGSWSVVNASNPNRLVTGDKITNAITLKVAETSGPTGIVKVQFYWGDQLVGEDTTLPFVYRWEGLAYNTYELKAVMTAANGDTSEQNLTHYLQEPVTQHSRLENAPNDVTTPSREVFVISLDGLKSLKLPGAYPLAQWQGGLVPQPNFYTAATGNSATYTLADYLTPNAVFPLLGAAANLTVDNYIGHPIAAFGTQATGYPLYDDQFYRFVVHAGSVTLAALTKNVGGTAYDEGFFWNHIAWVRVCDADYKNSGVNIATGWVEVVIPRDPVTVTAPTVAAALAEYNAEKPEAVKRWTSFIKYGSWPNADYTEAQADNLYTEARLASQTAYTAQGGSYVITHRYSPPQGAPRKNFVVAATAAVSIKATSTSTTMVNAVILQTNSGRYPLYALQFDGKPSGWQAQVLGQTWFGGEPMPSEYAGKSVEELLQIDGEIKADAFPAASYPQDPYVEGLPADDPNWTRVSLSSITTECPSLRKYQALDVLVDNLTKGFSTDQERAIALINYVTNEIGTVDPIGYNDNTTNGVANVSINPPGVTRNAYGVYLQGQGNPIEQCSLLVYMLRRANVPAVYAFPADNSLIMLDKRMSQALGFQVRGAVDRLGNLENASTLLPVNYPWVTLYVNGQWHHVFPWIKDIETIEGPGLFDFMPPQFDSGRKIMDAFVMGDKYVQSPPGSTTWVANTSDPFGKFITGKKDTPADLLPPFFTEQIHLKRPDVSLDQIGIRQRQRPHLYSTFDEMPRPLKITANPTFTRDLISDPNLFDMVRYQVGTTGDTTPAIVTAQMYAADVCNRRLSVSQQLKTLSGTAPYQMEVALVMAPSEYDDFTFETTTVNGTAFTNVTAGIGKRQVKTTLIGVTSNVTIQSEYWRQRKYTGSDAASTGTAAQDGANVFLGYQSYKYSKITSNIKGGDRAAICTNFGRVTQRAVDVLLDEQRKGKNTFDGLKSQIKGTEDIIASYNDSIAYWQADKAFWTQWKIDMAAATNANPYLTAAEKSAEIAANNAYANDQIAVDNQLISWLQADLNTYTADLAALKTQTYNPYVYMDLLQSGGLSLLGVSYYKLEDEFNDQLLRWNKLIAPTVFRSGTAVMRAKRYGTRPQFKNVTNNVETGDWTGVQLAQPYVDMMHNEVTVVSGVRKDLGQDSISVRDDFNPLWLINTSASEHVAIERFFAQDEVDAVSTMKLLELSRRDGLTTSYNVASNMNTGTSVTVTFASRQGGTAGQGIQIIFAADPNATAAAPVVVTNVAQKTVTITLSSKTGLITTAQQVVDSLAPCPLIYGWVSGGTASTQVGNRVINYSPLATNTAANPGAIRLTQQNAATVTSDPRITFDTEDTALNTSLQAQLTTGTDDGYTLAYVTSQSVTGAKGYYKGAGALINGNDSRFALLGSDLTPTSGGSGSNLGAASTMIWPPLITNITTTGSTVGNWTFGNDAWGNVGMITTTTPTSLQTINLAGQTLNTNLNTNLILSGLGTIGSGSFTVNTGLFNTMTQSSFTSFVNLTAPSNGLWTGTTASSLASLTFNTGALLFGSGNQTNFDLLSTVGDPVNIVTGAFYVDEVDLTMPGPIPLQIRRNYSSQSDAYGQFGWGWRTAFFPFLVPIDYNGHKRFHSAEPDGSNLTYDWVGTDAQGNEMWKPLPGKENSNPMLVNLRGENIGSTANPFNNKIVKTTGTDQWGYSHIYYTLYGADGSTRVFEERSYPIYGDTYPPAVERKRPYLTKWTDNRGNALTFTFGQNDFRQPDYGEVIRIDSTNGASVSFVYDGYGHVSEVLSNDGRHLYYNYDDEGDLRSVTKPDGSVVRYEYQFDGVKNESTHLLIREVKPGGRIVRNVYDTTKRVTEQYVSMEGDRQVYPGQPSLSDSGQTLRRIAAFTYNQTRTAADNTTTYYDVYNGTTTASDARNKQVTYTYVNSLMTQIDDPEPGVVESRAWYSQADVTNGVDGAYAYSVRNMTDKRGLSSTFKYDANGNLKKVIQTGDVTGDGTSDTVTIDLEYNSNNLITHRLISKDGNLLTWNTANETRWLYEDTNFPWQPTRIQSFSQNSGFSVPPTSQSTMLSETKMVYGSVYAFPGAYYQYYPYAKGLVTSSTQAFGTSDAATTTIDYTPQGYPSHISKPTGTSDPAVQSWLRYNSRGELVEENDAADPAQSQKRTFFAYDGLGNPIWTERRDHDGNLVGWEYRYYNGNGELEWSDGPKFAPEDYTYLTYTQTGKAKEAIVWRVEAAAGDDVSNLTNRVVQPARSGDKYSVNSAVYDTADMLTSTLDPLGNETRNFYDDLGRVTRKEVWQGKAQPGVAPVASQPGTWHANLLDFETYTYEPGGNVNQKQGRYVENTTTYAYTADGKLKQQNNPDGTSLTRRYDTLGHLVMEEIQPLASVTTIQTDDIARSVYTSTTSGGKTVTKQVIADRRGNVISTTDTLNQTVTATYDRLNRVKTQTGAAATAGSAQDTTTFYYDAVGLVTRSTNSLGESTVITKDALGRTIKTEVQDSAGGVVKRTSVDYFANHHGSAVTEGSGSQTLTTVTYVNEQGKPVLVIDGKGKFSRSRYDAAGYLNTSEEPAQYVPASGGYQAGYIHFVSTFQHDALGRPTSQTNANNATTTFAYTWTTSGLQVDRIMPTGQSWNTIERIVSDRLGRPVQSSLLGQGGASTRQNTTAYYTGTESTAAARWKGMVKSVTDGRGVTVVREYDDLARLEYLRATGSADEHNVTNHYLYDDLGRMVRADQDYTNYPTATDPTRTRIYRSYDQRGAIHSERVAMVDSSNVETDHSVWTQAWDAAGRRTGLSNGLSPVSGTGTAGGQYGFGYRADDRLISTSMDGQNFYFGYDARGLLSRRTNTWRETKISARDSLGRILESSSYFNGTAPGANVNSFTETQTWTERSKLATYGFSVQGPVITALQLPAPPPLTGPVPSPNYLNGISKNYNYTYTNGGQLFAEAQGDYTQDNVPTWLYGFDHDDLGGSGNISLGTTPTLGVRSSGVFKHTTSGAWNLRAGTGFVAGYNGSAFTSGFDAYRRATAHVLKIKANTSGLDLATSSAYDAEGFQLQRYGHELYPTGTTPPALDSQPYQSMTWDAFGRLVRCSTTEFSGYLYTIGGVTYWSYQSETKRFSAVYDALGRRLRTVDATVDPVTTVVNSAPAIDSHYDPQVEFLELGITIGTTSRQWKVYGPDANGSYGGLQGIGGLEAVRMEQSNEWTYVQSDLFGNVVGYKVGTSAAVWTNAEINSYGLITNKAQSTLVLSSANPNVATLSLWRGKRTDSTGLYWLGARYYDPINGRFLSPDPKGHGSSPSLYDYANGDPVNNVDPDGRMGRSLVNVGSNMLSSAWSFVSNGIYDSTVGSAMYGSLTTALLTGNFSNYANYQIGQVQGALNHGISMLGGLASMGNLVTNPMGILGGTLGLPNPIQMGQNWLLGQASNLVQGGVNMLQSWGLYDPNSAAAASGQSAGAFGLEAASWLVGVGEAKAGSLVSNVAEHVMAGVERGGMDGVISAARGVAGEVGSVVKGLWDNLFGSGCFVKGTAVAMAIGVSTPIEAVTVGQCVATDPCYQTGAERMLESSVASTEIDRNEWRKVALELGWETPQAADDVQCELLRPVAWLESVLEPGQSLNPGACLWLSIEELGLHGRARLTAVEPCPAIETGSGHTVLGTITRYASHLHRLTVSDEANGASTSIEVTGTHPIYSATRHEWVPAGELAPGEWLVSKDGRQQVTANHRLPGLQRVFNLEVQSAHRYFVSDARVLVHNACGGSTPPPLPTGQSVIAETFAGVGGPKNITSAYTIHADEALSAGQQFVGPGYREIGNPGSGVFRSSDGLRQFRMDSNSLAGSHAPNVPHVHFEIYPSPTAPKPIVNNHVPFFE